MTHTILDLLTWFANQRTCCLAVFSIYILLNKNGCLKSRQQSEYSFNVSHRHQKAANRYAYPCCVCFHSSFCRLSHIRIFSAFRKSFKYLNIFIYASWKIETETENVDVPFQVKYDESKINGKQIKRNETMCNQARNVK